MNENFGIGGEGDCNASQIIDANIGRHRDRSQLCDLHGTLADDMTSQNPAATAVDDQLAEAEGATFDDRAYGSLEWHERGDDFVVLARFRLR